MLVGLVMQSATLLGRELREGTGEATRSVAPDSSMRTFAHGSFLYMKGEYWGAIDTFRKIPTRTPGEAAAVHYAISMAFSSLAVPDSSRFHGEAAVRLDPGNMHYSRYLARLAHEMQDYERAAELYGQAAIAAPDRVDILYAQALEYVAANKPAEALEVFGQVLKLDHLDEKALSQSLWLQIAIKHYQDAIVTLKQLIDIAGNNQKLQITLGQLYDLTGRGDMAVETFKGIIASDRNAVPAWVALFDQRIRSGSRDELLREFREFDGLAPADAGKVVEVTRLFANRSGHDSLYVEPVFSMLDELVLRHPGDSRVHVLKGAYEMTRDRQVLAVSSFSRAVTLEPRNIEAWDGLVMAHVERQDKRMVYQTITRAKRALPRQASRLSVLEGYALFHTGSPARAARVLEKAAGSKTGVKDHDLLIQANTTLAMAYEQLGSKKRSGQAYARVLELDPHNSLAMNNLAYLYAEEGIMLQKALRLAQTAVLLEPENGVFLDTLGWVHFHLGSYASARDMLEKAVATGIGEAEIYGHLGAVYEKLGESDKAREMLDRAKALKGKPSVP
jgi:tetratricopeptide (TPR) repeat protein